MKKRSKVKMHIICIFKCYIQSKCCEIHSTGMYKLFDEIPNVPALFYCSYARKRLLYARTSTDDLIMSLRFGVFI